MIGLTTAVAVMMVMMRKAPAEASIPTGADAIPARTIKVEPTDVQVTLKGFGVAREKHTVTLTTEIAGRVVEINPRLEVGNVIEQGEVLFRLDDSRVKAEKEEIEAQLARLDSSVKKLKTEEKKDAVRVETLRRSHELAKSQHARAVELFKEAIGNQNDVDTAEEKLNQVSNEMRQMESQLAVYPILIEEVEHSIQAEEARLKRTQLDLDQAAMYAPFTGRVTSHDVELGQYLNAFSDAVTLADDSHLEIAIKLDAAEAQRWLQFDADSKSTSSLSWFDDLTRVDCAIRWTESENDTTYIGTLERVEQYDPESRTLTIIVDYAGKGGSSDSAFPLVAGMFCEVALPGRTLKNAYAVPYEAVGLDGVVYTVEKGLLATKAVTVARTEGDHAYITEGLEPGAELITTRLISPLEASPVEVLNPEPARAEQ